jgi:Family of unknown function (DUF5683)
MYKNILFVFFLLLSAVCCAQAQKKTLPDTAVAKKAVIKKKNKFSDIFQKQDTGKIIPPRIATIRSAVLPGWGQITNKKYWKLPLVYGALGVTAGVFFHNVKQFKTARDAYINATDGNAANDNLIPEPYFSVKGNPDRIKTFRNQVRQNVDYSIIFFLVFWGLNVVDATVDAHLKSFDVSDNLSLQLKAGYSPLAQTSGASLILAIGKNSRAK